MEVDAFIDIESYLWSQSIKATIDWIGNDLLVVKSTRKPEFKTLVLNQTGYMSVRCSVKEGLNGGVTCRLAMGTSTLCVETDVMPRSMEILT